MLRTHTCGELTIQDVKKPVTLCGWVQTRRDHGGIIFIDVRDRYGITQLVFDPKHNLEAHKIAEHLGREWVLRAQGTIRPRAPGMAKSDGHRLVGLSRDDGLRRGWSQDPRGSESVQLIAKIS